MTADGSRAELTSRAYGGASMTGQSLPRHLPWSSIDLLTGEGKLACTGASTNGGTVTTTRIETKGFEWFDV